MKKSLGLVSPKPPPTPTPRGKDEKAEPIDLAAHLQLLGESLGTIGACLRVQVRSGPKTLGVGVWAVNSYCIVTDNLSYLNMALTFESMDEILKCDHSKESY